MSIRDVLLWPDPRLSQVCAPVEGDIAPLIADLFDTMYAANGRGLAAPQIGVLQRVFVVDVTWKEGVRDPRVFINPLIEGRGDAMQSGQEQCLSIPDLPMSVVRPATVRLAWQTPEREPRAEEFTGVLARCIQHEYDHLDGKVIFDHQTPDTRAALEAAYGR